jgi:hypothetical protein
MFVLNPGGSRGGGGKELSPVRQQLMFFGNLAIYFVVIRGAYLFFSAREERKTLQ